ncbi:MAG: hypothetical protein QOD94_108, partial [Alphaproteobacteria bacterium]|nr:hypothetical protein [Alphaproteobacteria bacterium]
RISWDPPLVVASIVLGAAIAAVALPTGLAARSLEKTVLGGLLLTLAICSHHFTAMAAASIRLDPGVAVPETALPTEVLALGVALASLTILLLTFAGLWVDLRDRRRAELEADRMRGLANAAVEGLLVCDGPQIVSINSSFGKLTGVDPDSAPGQTIADFLTNDAVAMALEDGSNPPFETTLRRSDGTLIPVEIIKRPINFAGKIHCAIAVHDLRNRKRSEARIHFLAHHDTLTGLPNRNAFSERLDEKIRAHQVTGRKLAVLCLDLDRFKEVNDLFGHAAGDDLLQAFAACVTQILNPNQVMARIGGDEFAIAAPNLSDPAQAGKLAEEILEAVARQNEGAVEAPLLSTSIGIAVFPDDGVSRADLLNQADTALYRAKAEGGGVYRFFEAAMGAQVRERRLLDHDLRHAISRNELSIVYQPLTQIRSGKVFGFEALLRWRHPERGDVSPATFIPIAEETGLILQIGEWVLHTACLEAASWMQPLSVAVNVSAAQLHNHGFAQLVHGVLFETGLAPHRLELEVTETALIRNRDLALATLRRLKALGVRIAMDDFGTGYSSLSNLRAFPFDKIKIDGSFIHAVDVSPEAATIVRAVLGLGRGLGLPVIAEGVETSGELNFLDGEQCSEAQGYFLGRPEPIHIYRQFTHRAVGDPATVAADNAVSKMSHKAARLRIA